MRTPRGVLTASGIILVCAVAMPGTVRAQLGVGTWEKKASAGMTGSMTMTVEMCCKGGRKLTYHIGINSTKSLMTVESPFDGTAVPVLVNGKPSGETMAIKRTDERHTFTVLKMNGQPYGTSKATLSADGKLLTVINETIHPKGIQTEIWIKK